jgi:hypothetical protein
MCEYFPKIKGHKKNAIYLEIVYFYTEIFGLQLLGSKKIGSVDESPFGKLKL